MKRKSERLITYQKIEAFGQWPKVVREAWKQ